MIVDIEKLKEARTLLRAKMYSMEDGLLEQRTELVTDLLRDIIDDLELCGESIIEIERRQTDEVGKTK